MDNAQGADFGVFTQDGSDTDTRWVRFTDFKLRMRGKLDL
jgi:hypothetical protein